MMIVSQRLLPILAAAVFLVACYYSHARRGSVFEFASEEWTEEAPPPQAEDGAFKAKALSVGEIAQLRWHDGELVTDNLYRIGLPTSVRTTLLKLIEENGIMDAFRHIDDNPIAPGDGEYQKFKNEEWYVQRPEAKWKTNMHWISPAGEAAQQSYLRALGDGGFDQVLEAIGTYFNMDGISAYHLTFIGVSHCTEGYVHYDFGDTDAKAYNIIIPLQLVEDSSPELDILGKNDVVKRYKYEYDTGVIVGDQAFHATSAVDYTESGGMRVAATVYIADINEENVDGIIDEYTQEYPPVDREFLLAHRAEHWGHGNILPKSLNHPPQQCGLYIAPYTIPNAGLGIFTAVSRQKGDYIGYGDIVIPIVDGELNMGEEKGEFFNIFDDYTWDAYTHAMHHEGNVWDTYAWCPGIDSAVNSNMGLINVERGDFTYDDCVGGHRSESPSAGAMTPYHEQLTIASYDIPAGSEIFKSYGNEWFELRTEELGLLPLEENYLEAEVLLRELKDLEDRLQLSDAVRRGLYDILLDPFWKSRTLNAFPPDFSDVSTVVKDSFRALHQENAIRSSKDLNENGRCLDNMQPKNSTLPFAGRGAFATRDLPKGTIVTGSPLLHIPSGDLAKKYVDPNDKHHFLNRNEFDKPIGFHLFYNYCFGHNESSLLLCPYGGGVNYMNHNQSLANIKIQWAPDGIMAQNNSWMNVDPSEMEVRKPFVGIDYVATRDIRNGEELFLDYGDEFEQAWQAYIISWEPFGEDRSYVTATQWNQDHADDVLRTKEEQEEYPYPENLVLQCHPFVWTSCMYVEAEQDDAEDTEEAHEETEDTDEDTENDDGGSSSWYDNDLWPSWEKGHKCEVIARSENDNPYSVEIWDDTEEESRLCQDVSRELFTMIDGQYTTDWHKRNAFRHYIGIPDDMVPDAWRNVRN